MPVLMPTKLKTLQLCRGLAAALVLLFHATSVSSAFLNYDLLHGVFLFGYSGVDFFFVLSGFIIFWVHSVDLGHPARLRPYLRKRFIRIYPLYWVVFLVLLPIYFRLPNNFHDCLVLLKSFLLLPQVSNPVLTVAWTLSSELFFYGLFGLAICLSWKHMRAVVIFWLLCTFVFWLAKLLTYGTFQMPPHLGFVFSAYNLEFAMGCLAAYLAGSLRPYRFWWLAPIGLALFLTCGLTERFLHPIFGRHHSILAYGVPSMLLVLGSVQWERRGVRTMPPYLLLLGDASYSIYLTHFALLDLCVRGSVAVGIVTWTGPWLVILISIATAFTIGVMIHLFIEKPLLAHLRKKSGGVDSANQQQPAPVELLP